MRDYVRVQPEGTIEFDFLRLDEDSANWFSGLPENDRPIPWGKRWFSERFQKVKSAK
jgi:hypothetical protein